MPGGSPPPRKCPVCGSDREDGYIPTPWMPGGTVWTVYWRHLDTNHPDFSRWVLKTSQIYWLATIPLIFVPFIGDWIVLPTNFLLGVSLILAGPIFTIAYTVAVWRLIRKPGFKRFRELWSQQHGGLSSLQATPTE